MKKLLLLAAMGLGLVGCTKDANLEETQDSAVRSYMAVKLTMPGGLRANADGQDKANPDYNYVGQWAGKDKIEKISIYMVPTVSSEPIEKQEALNFSDYYYNEPTPATDGSNKVLLTPKKGIKVGALAGKEVKVYVIINDIQNKAKDLLASATASDFEIKYKEAIELLTQQNAVAKAKVEQDNTAAGKIAKKNSTDNETILMTAFEPSQPLTIKANISENKAIQGPENQAVISVERAVARVMVTIKEDASFTVNAPIKLGSVAKGDTYATISDVKWVVAQGERKVFLSKNKGTSNNTFLTPGSEFVPSNNFNTAAKYYDYTPLWVDYDGKDKINGVPVPTIKDYDVNTKDKVTAELQNKLSGQFILPNTHDFGKTTTDSKYKKGNTAYVLIRAKFVPKPEAFEDNDVELVPTDLDYNDKTVCDQNTHRVKKYKEGEPFYVGTNGKFYRSPNTARDPKCGGVNGMKTNKYINNKVLYFAWLNPDKPEPTQWLNSPVVRNNIYHVHINSFKTIGVNWNPLVPVPDGSTEYNNPNNPDPNPNEEGNDPKDNPIKPDDPLSNQETYMSVSVTVLPWQLHSYKIDLGF
ncbi:Mfa1 family fimbria major subunit [Falsiporphyromonas endometrii]|uniref:Mfa1 family fimbria major subunit n=1 Tax=Falsiporphyromonas endometrii TaxID=1387297 RepID=A0ABV9K6Z7_9PORP